MNKPQRKVSIDLNIRSATLKVDEPMEILIVWKRGTKKIDTRSRIIDQSRPQAVFNEKFQMKTALDYDTLRRQFIKKKSDLQVWKKDMSVMLGSADFDLSKYANDERAQDDRLPLKNCTIDSSAYIEIYIKAKVLDQGVPQTPSMRTPGMQLTSMPTIEERDSEADVREELERKEKEYRRNIERLEDMLDDLRRKEQETEQTQNSTLNATNTSFNNETLNQTVIGYEAGDVLEMREKELLQLEQELTELDYQNANYLLKLDLLKQIDQMTGSDHSDSNYTNEEIQLLLEKYQFKAKSAQEEAINNLDRLEYLYSFDRFDYQAL
eukprot:403375936